MKLAQFETRKLANQGVQIRLKDLRTGRATDAVITVLGGDSDKFSEAVAERARRVREIHEREGREPNPAEWREMSAETLAACTVGWSGLEDDSGAALEFTPAAARHLYTNYPAIKDQINEAMATRALFLSA